MVVSIISNKAALVSERNIALTERKLNRAYSAVSSGLRVFSAQEDAASLAIGTGLRMDVSALKAAQINAGQAVAALQIADGAMGTLSQILYRMQTLASTSQSDTLSDSERGYIDAEYQLLVGEFDRIGSQAQFNGQPLLGGANNIVLQSQDPGVSAASGFAAFQFTPGVVNDLDQFTVSYDDTTKLMTVNNVTQGKSQSMLVAGPNAGFLNTYNFSSVGVKLTLSSSFDPLTPMAGTPGVDGFQVQQSATAVGATFEYQIGIGTGISDRIQVSMPVANASVFGLAGTDIQTKANASIVQDRIKTAADLMDTARARLGADLNRIEFASSNIATSIENTETARSIMMDADVSEEASQIYTQQALLQAGTAVLAQANTRAETLLQLILGK